MINTPYTIVKNENPLYNYSLYYNLIRAISYENITLLLNILQGLHIHHTKSPIANTSHNPSEVDLK